MAAGACVCVRSHTGAEIEEERKHKLKQATDDFYYVSVHTHTTLSHENKWQKQMVDDDAKQTTTTTTATGKQAASRPW